MVDLPATSQTLPCIGNATQGIVARSRDDCVVRQNLTATVDSGIAYSRLRQRQRGLENDSPHLWQQVAATTALLPVISGWDCPGCRSAPLSVPQEISFHLSNKAKNMLLDSLSQTNFKWSQLWISLFHRCHGARRSGSEKTLVSWSDRQRFGSVWLSVEIEILEKVWNVRTQAWQTNIAPLRFVPLSANFVHGWFRHDLIGKVQPELILAGVHHPGWEMTNLQSWYTFCQGILLSGVSTKTMPQRIAAHWK